jgi:hypothetical protein
MVGTAAPSLAMRVADKQKRTPNPDPEAIVYPPANEGRHAATDTPVQKHRGEPYGWNGRKHVSETGIASRNIPY